MELVQSQLNLPKESKEVADAVVVLLKDILAKKSAAEIVADALPKALAAADGFAAVGDELKSKNRSDLAAYLVKELMDSLVPGA
jgi:hypothetical protein